eukprot:942178-Ditylum_brightwellii.AAC.1
MAVPSVVYIIAHLSTKKLLGASNKDARKQSRICEQPMEALRDSLQDCHRLPTVQLLYSPATQKPGA